MPNTNRKQTAYVVTGNPDTLNITSADWDLQNPGQLGMAFDANDRAYQFVQVDSGCTAATAVGVVAANEIAFWKDKDQYLVTNDRAQAIGGSVANAYRNQVAGIFRNAVTAGRYTAILQRGDNIPVREVNSAGGIGQHLIAEAAATAGVAFDALGASTYQQIGVARAAGTGVFVLADVDIPNIP